MELEVAALRQVDPIMLAGTSWNPPAVSPKTDRQRRWEPEKHSGAQSSRRLLLSRSFTWHRLTWRGLRQ